jgi:hypothetical protein
MTKQLTIQERITAKRRRQAPNELRRKALKAARRGWWTQEDLDYLFADGVSDHVKSLHHAIFGSHASNEYRVTPQAVTAP